MFRQISSTTVLTTIGCRGTDILMQLVGVSVYTDEKENKIFLIYKEIHIGAVAKSSRRKGFLIYEEMGKYLVIYGRPLVI